jgi:hypothetical protein
MNVDNDVVGCVINGKRLLVNKQGCIWYVMKNGLREISNIGDTSKYNRIWCKGKRYLRHRILGYVFLGLDLDNLKTQVDHIDRDKLNNSVSNLRIVNNKQNSYNTDALGYSKYRNKYRSSIKAEGVYHHLGYFDSPSSAREAYLKAKEIYHIIN